MRRPPGEPPHFMTDADLDFIYVIVDPDLGPREQGELLTVRQMSDKQFREWIVGLGNYHSIPLLPTFGRIGHEQRLRLINYLIQRGIKIHRLGGPQPDV